jgi:hypothetical protein
MALSAAAALTVFAVRYTRSTSASLASETAVLGRVRDIGSEMEACNAFVRAYEGLPRRNLVELDGVFGRNAFLPKPDERRQSSAELLPGWSLRTEEVSFREVSVTAALKSAQAAEHLRPPWRMVKLTVRSPPQAGEKAQVVMSFRGIAAER